MFYNVFVQCPVCFPFLYLSVVRDIHEVQSYMGGLEKTDRESVHRELTRL